MKNRNLIESFNNAIKGIISAIKSERNMKIHIIAGIIVFFMSMFYDISKLEFMIICIAVAIVIVCELFNTAIEELANMITTEYHERVKRIKDISAGAVLTSTFFAVIVGYFIFFERISNGLESGVERIRQYPMHIVVIALVITIALVLVLKALTNRGTFFKGGMPSGHAAIASAVTTSVALWSLNSRITLLCIILSLLVIQSRLEAKIHSSIEVFLGAVLGFLITLLFFQIFI